jgi:hypothetical protein
MIPFGNIYRSSLTENTVTELALFLSLLVLLVTFSSLNFSNPCIFDGVID